jgi:hypothetical protein
MADSVSYYNPADYIPATLTEEDKKRLNKQAWGEYGTAAATGAIGTAAQLGLSAIDTDSEAKNKEELAKLQDLEKKGELGLSADVKQEYEHAVMNPVRAAVGAMQRREDAAQAASGRSDAAAVARSQRVASEVLADQAAKAGTQIEQANIAERARQRSEIESRTASESARERQRIELVGQSLSGLMQNFAKVSAANPSTTGMTDGEIMQMAAMRKADGTPLYPGLQGSLDTSRALIEAGDITALMGNRPATGTIPPNARSEGG